jgi:hypothetical protein
VISIIKSDWLSDMIVINIINITNFDWLSDKQYIEKLVSAAKKLVIT